jgi:aspartyl-tRNA(Asn)/glutamyl-tRNA(Gln) amidotransferase subunit C
LSPTRLDAILTSTVPVTLEQKMSLSQQDVEKIANLARLALTDEEKILYQEQLSAVLDYAERLNRLDIEIVPPTSSVVGLANIWRDDVIEPSLPTADALYNAVQVEQDQFRIQPVLDDG